MTGPRTIATGGPALPAIFALLGIAALAVVLGAALAYGNPTPLLVVALLIIFAIGWQHVAYAVPAALLVLALNGVPFLNLETFAVPGSFQPEDITIIGLILIAAGRLAFGEQRPVNRFQRFLWIWSPIFLVVWLAATIRGIDAGASPLKASLFGRDFLYFAILAPLAGYLFSGSRDLRRFCVIVGAWTGLFAAFLVLANLGVVNASLVNASLTSQVGLVTRIYTPMIDLVVVVFAVSLAYALIETGRGRNWALLLALLTGFASALSLTRALYFGLLVGIAIGVCVWALRGSESGQRLRRRLATTMGTLAVLGVLSLVAFPGLTKSGPVSVFGERIQSGVSALTTGRTATTANTVTYRVKLSEAMLRYLGDRWPLGVGFVPPSVHYVPSLPSGTIRNPDVGLLNGVMTIGVLGTILLYAPVVFLLTILFARSAEPSARWQHLWLGLMIWGATVLASSVTLGVLFSRTGLVLTSVVLGSAAQSLSFNNDSA